MGRAHLRVVAIDGVALEDAPPPSRHERADQLTAARQQREIRQLKEQWRRLRGQPRGLPARRR